MEKVFLPLEEFSKKAVSLLNEKELEEEKNSTGSLRQC